MKAYYLLTFQWLIIPADEKEDAYWKHDQVSFTNLKQAKKGAKRISQYYRYKNVHLLKVTPNKEIEF